MLLSRTQMSLQVHQRIQTSLLSQSLRLQTSCKVLPTKQVSLLRPTKSLQGSWQETQMFLSRTQMSLQMCQRIQTLLPSQSLRLQTLHRLINLKVRICFAFNISCNIVIHYQT